MISFGDIAILTALHRNIKKVNKEEMSRHSRDYTHGKCFHPSDGLASMDGELGKCLSFSCVYML